MSVFASLLKRQTVTWQLDDGFQPARQGEQQVRFTLRSVSVLDDIRRAALLEAGRAWLTETLDIDPEAFVESTKDRQLERRDVEIFAAMRQVANWAAIVVSIEKLEAQPEGGEWAAIPVPDAWFTFEGFAAEIPGDLFTRLIECAHELNPLLWAVPMDDDAKKNGSSNEHKSKASSKTSSTAKAEEQPA